LRTGICGEGTRGTGGVDATGELVKQPLARHLRGGDVAGVLKGNPQPLLTQF